MEHFEGHGDHWNALGFEDHEIVEKIEESVKKGVLLKNKTFENFDIKIIPIVYPVENPVQFCSLVVSKNNKNTADAFFPILEGIKNTVVFDNKFTWENNLEGEVEFFRENRYNLSFYAPYFQYNFSKMKKGEKFDVYLSGLAFFVEKAEMEHRIDKGDMYKIALKDFLKNNPQKNQRDFPFVTLDMNGATILFPTDEYSVFEYRGKILDLNYEKIFDKRIIKAKVSLEKNDDEYNLFINLYFSEKNVRNCEIKIGNDIQCRLWLMGYI